MPEISLHVRALNRPALRVYTRLGLRKGALEFPGWYDWHGGYHLVGATAEVGAMATASTESSSLTRVLPSKFLRY